MRKPELVAMTPMWPYMPPLIPSIARLKRKLGVGDRASAQLEIVECPLLWLYFKVVFDPQSAAVIPHKETCHWFAAAQAVE